MRKFYLILFVAVVSYVPLDVFSQNPYIMTDGGLGSYGYIEKDATSNIYFRANSNSQSNIYQLFVRSLINGSTNYLTYGNAVDPSCTNTAATNVVQQTYAYTFPALNNGSQVLSSVHADYCGGSNSYGGNPNQAGYNTRTFQVVDVYSDNNSIATQILPTPSMPNNVVLSFVIDPGGVAGITFKQLWLTNAGTAAEVTDIPNNGFRLYYENYTGSETFGGTESYEQLYGDYGGNATNNNVYGHGAMNSGIGITIPSTGLRCYVVLATTNDCSIAGKSVKMSINADGISFSNSIDGFSNLKMDQIPSTGGTSLTATAVVGVTATAGTTTGSYCTLKAAFDAINAGTHQGTIAISIYGNTTETASAALNASGSGSASYTSVSIQPAGGGARSVSGSLAAAPLVDLNGADNITIDGLNTGGNSLTFSNTSTSGTTPTSTIRFYNDASNNSVKNCDIKGAGTATTTANILFSTATTTGSDNNSIINCNIYDASGSTPTNCILSNAPGNDNITIQGCNIYNFFHSGADHMGIRISSLSLSWTISNNSFYQTSSRALGSGNQFSFIGNTGQNMSGFTISNNYFGGTAANCGSTALTMTGSGNFRGLNIGGPAGTTNLIQNNTFKNISFTSSNASTAHGLIVLVNGAATIGGSNSTGNVFGSTSSNGSITVNLTNTTGGSTAIFSGITGYTGAANGTTDISFNTFSGFDFASSSNGTNDNLFRMIYMLGTFFANNYSIYNNTIGSAALANSIKGTDVDNIIAGIYIAGSNSNTITPAIYNNTIYDLSNTGTTTNSGVVGIHYQPSTASQANIYSNTISKLSATASVNGINVQSGTTVGIYSNNINNLTFGAGSNATLSGIRIQGPATPNVYSNTINTLITNGTSSTVNGIVATGYTTASVYANKIYDLTGNSTGNTVNGIFISGAGTTFRCYNNFISNLKAPAVNNALAVYGINLSNGTNHYIYYNSVYVNASSTGTNFGSSAIYSVTGSTTVDLRNNIFINTSVANGTGLTVVLRRNVASLTNYSTNSNNNLYYAGTPSATNLIYYDGTNSYQNFSGAGSFQTAVSTRETNSITGSVTFYNTATGDLHTSDATVQNKGQDVSAASPLAVSVDFDGNNRKPGCGGTDIGADEEYLNSSPSTYNLWTGKSDTKWCSVCNWDNEAVPTASDSVIITTTTSGNYPLLNTAAGCAASVCKGININGSGSLTIQAGGSLSVYGNFTNSGTFNHTGGDINFAGTTQQVISSTSDLSFYNLTFSGGGAKSLTANATVNGTLGLTSGVVTLSSGNYLAMPAGVNYTGGGSSSYINGTIRKYFNSSETSFTFPTGNATRYGPVTLSNISAPSTSEYMAVSYATGPFSGDHRNILTPVPAAPTNSVQSVDFASYVEYWNMSFSNTSSAFKAQLTLNYTNNSYSQLYNKGADWLRVTRYDGIGVLDYGNDNPLGDQSSGVSGSINSANQLAASVFSSGSIFTFGTTANGVNPLPAILKSFSASKQTGYNKLDWNVSCQGKSLQFDVLRSADGRNFQSIYSFGADQNRCNQPFAFNDYGASGAKIYYRIKITDENGKVIYTQVAVIINRDKGFEITGLMPNPATEMVYLNISSGSRDKLQLVVTDITGKQVMSNTAIIVAGSNMISLPVRNLAKGVYTISGVYSDGRTETLRFVKQ